MSLNPEISNIEHELLSNEWGTLYRIDYDYQFKNGEWRRVSRECYNRGNGTAILLYNRTKATVILTKQFRMPAFENSKSEGMSIEVCAGALDTGENAETCIIREVKEEVGYRIHSAREVLQTYMSPGAITEKLHLFVAEVSDEMKMYKGGGLESENEEIEILEIKIEEALRMIDLKEIRDAKTIMLLQFAQINNLLV